MDCIPHVHVTEVQWSNGYDFCLTCVLSTEGSRFDPGLNHFFVFFGIGYVLDHIACVA